MNESMKKLLIPVAVILVCAIILAAAGAGLAGTAAANAEKELNDMISYLMPGGGEFEEVEYTGSDAKITNVYKGEGGYVLAMTTNGFVDEIKLLVAVDNDGVVKGYTVRVFNLVTPSASDSWNCLAEIEGKESAMRTVNAAYFQSTRLLGLQTRNSAAEAITYERTLAGVLFLVV